MDINAKKYLATSAFCSALLSAPGKCARRRLPALIKACFGGLVFLGTIGSAQAALPSLVTEPALLSGEGPFARVSLHKGRSGREYALSHHHIVPVTMSDGLVLNLPQRMLYFFKGGQLSAAYPIAVGKADWRTPRGGFQVTNLQMNKTWHVPKSIQEEMRNEGEAVKTSIGPGPKNPLGKYWIGVSLPGIGIHGTIAPSSIYRFASHGCVRLHPHDIEALYSQVHVGERGQIIYKPVLLARTPEGRIYVEANPDPYHMGPANAFQYIQSEAAANHLTDAIDWQQVKRALSHRDGVAHEVGKGAANTYYAYGSPAPVKVKARRAGESRPAIAEREPGPPPASGFDYSMRPEIYGPEYPGAYGPEQEGPPAEEAPMPVIMWPRP